MNENQPLLKQYNEEEIKELLNSKVKLVYVDTGLEEIVARYEDLPDVIVDINDKLGLTDLSVYEYGADSMTPILTTGGPFLDRCDPNVREDIIERLIELQLGEKEVKDYKVIDEDMLDDVLEELNDEEHDGEMER